MTKRIVITIAVLAAVVLGGLMWHTFTRQAELPEEWTDPTDQSYLYLYPEEEMVVDFHGHYRNGEVVYLVRPGRMAAKDVRYEDQSRYYNLSPGGTLYSLFWKEAYGRFHWHQVKYDLYDHHTGVVYVERSPRGFRIRWSFDFDGGWCIPGGETEALLREVLPQTGLNEAEQTDLIEVWLPRLRGNPYNRIAFFVDHPQQPVYQSDLPDDYAPIDSSLQVFLIAQPPDAPVELPPQTCEPFAREGFTVVQWGGVVIEKGK